MRFVPCSISRSSAAAPSEAFSHATADSMAVAAQLIEQRFQRLDVDPGTDQRRRDFPAIRHPLIVQPRAEFVLQIALRQRVEVSGTIKIAGGIGAKLEQLIELIRLKLATERNQQRLDLVEGLVQLTGSAARGGSGIVQLVRQPRREDAEGRHFLALAGERFGRLDAPRERAEQLADDHRADGEHLAEGLVVEAEKLRRLERPRAGNIGGAAEQGNLAAEAAVVVGGEYRFAAVDVLRDLQFAGDDHVKVIGVLPLPEDVIALLGLVLLPVIEQPLELIVAQVLKQGHGTQLIVIQH